MLLTLLVACVTTLTLRSPDPEGAMPAEAPSIAAAAPTGFPDWTVDCEGGGDFRTIGDAIDVASDGDWIAVAPCTYSESLDYGGKTLWIASTGSSADTVLDAGRGRAITAMYGTGDASALVGFTISDARDDSTAPVYLDQSALRLEDVVFEDSSGAYALVYAYASDLELQDVVFDDSNRTGYDGALLISRGALVADNLSVACRTASTAAYVTHGSYFIDHSLLECGGGKSLVVDHSIGRVHRSSLPDDVAVESEEDHYDDTVIFENTHLEGAISVAYGSILIRNSFMDGATLTLDQVYGFYLQATVVAHTTCPITYSYTGTDPDTADDGEDTGEDTGPTYEPDPVVDVSYSLFFDNRFEHCDHRTTYSGQDGNLSGDPLFTDEEGGDYTAAPGSPMVDAGLPDSAYNDPDGTVNDIGLYGGPRSIGGGW